jgi:Fe-Mn family superoxide dismutase
MSSTLLRTVPALRGALRASGAPKAAAALASTTFVRGKATLPDLSCKSIHSDSYCWTCLYA